MNNLLRSAINRSPSENMTRLYFRLNPKVRAALLKLPTVNEWWHLASKYPAFRRVTKTPIKDFGYLTILEYLDKHHPRRVLEFGHGLWHMEAQLLYDRTDVEFWACDDFLGLAYQPAIEEWHRKYTAFTSQFPRTRFVKCLLGDPDATRELLPENYFDMVCSVSVLEELKPEVLTRVLEHAHRLLIPGGRLLCSFDVRVRNFKPIVTLIGAVKAAHFEWRVESRFLAYANWDRALLESQISVMLYYQVGEGEKRHFPGNWTTLIIDARKANG